jgi:hypothetical protein
MMHLYQNPNTWKDAEPVTEIKTSKRVGIRANGRTKHGAIIMTLYLPSHRLKSYTAKF